MTYAHLLQIAGRVVPDERSDVSQRRVPAQQRLPRVGHLRQRQSVLLGQLIVDFENLSSRSVHLAHPLFACDVRPQTIVNFQKPIQLIAR